MNSSSFISFTLVYILIFLVPGLISLRVLFYLSGKKYDLSRVHLVVYSTALSALSGLILYSGSGFLYNIVTSAGSFLNDYLGISSISDLLGLSGPALLIVFLLHSTITLFVGVILGKSWKGVRVKRNIIFDPREAWEFAFDESPDPGEMIEVTLRSGRVIQGEVNTLAFDSDVRELFLDNPWIVEYGSDNENIINRADMGRSIYLHSDAIEEVVFLEEDPNVEKSGSISDGPDNELSDELEQSLEQELEELNVSEVTELSREDYSNRFEFIRD